MFPSALMPKEQTASATAQRLGCSRQYLNQMVRAGRVKPTPRKLEIQPGRVLYLFRENAHIAPSKRGPGRPRGRKNRKPIDKGKAPASE